MKKFFSLLLALLVFMLPVVTVSAKEEKEKIKFYIFYGEGCNFCEALHNYTDELQKDKKYKDMFEIVDYEVWYNQKNSTLMSQVAAYLKVDVTGVPFYVIGEQSFSGFSESTSPAKIEKAIEDAYNDEDYKDIVAGVGEGELTVEDSEKDEEDDKNKSKNDVVGYVIIGITAVVVIAIISSRSKDTYYDEYSLEDEENEEVEEDEEEVIEEETHEEEEKPKTTKKTNTSTSKKKTSTKKK